ncbi:MAG: cadmium-translocating P-type ATPase [Alistipes senegalensis]|nr:cadmium-translocating P-type ATPase [Oxalobacter formigenes]MCM1281110.1 cadmium-translocating P-type ATPase [Alistipes senegalensis]
MKCEQHEPCDHNHHHHHHDDLQEHLPVCGQGCCDVAKEPVVSALPMTFSSQAEVWEIPNMDCPVEEKEIRNALKDISGIRSLSFQLAARLLTIDATKEAKEKAYAAIGRAGYSPSSIRPAEDEKAHEPAPLGNYRRLGIALAVALGVEIIHVIAPDNFLFSLLTLGMAVLAIWLAGVQVYVNGVRALLHGRLNINALMAVAVTGSCLIGQWAEAAMVMVLYAIAELIEAHSVDRARHAVSRLLNLTPATAEKRLSDGSWEEKSVRDIIPGEIIRIRPGERIPLDGKVVSGFSTINQMAITGESIPVNCRPGDTVYAGSINESGVLELEVTALAQDTMLARIIAMVEGAQEVRAPIQRFVDRFAAVYTPSVFAVAVAVAFLMPLLGGWTWIDAIYRALVILVIACPCALVIATPLTVVSGLAAAARNGILIKGGIYLEEARKLKAVAFDKTGTITQGKPRVVAVEVTGKGADQQRILHWAAALSASSRHPVSQAVFEETSGVKLPGEVRQYRELPGKGIEAEVEGVRLRLGNIRWIREMVSGMPQADAFLGQHEAEGHTVTVMASDAGILALFAVADVIRASSRTAVEELVLQGITPVMLTGDNIQTAQSIAVEAGISHFRGELLPGDKLEEVAALKKGYGQVAMVGDGINDAPALAAADMGIAMGGAGTDIAMETADVIIMNDDLRRVADLVCLSRQTFGLLKQNIGFALGIKLAFFVMALTGYAGMWMAVFADVGATLLVVANGLRLLRWKSRFLPL